MEDFTVCALYLNKAVIFLKEKEMVWIIIFNKYN